MLWNSLEASHRDACNVYPQHMFSQKNKNTLIFLGLIVLVSTGSNLRLCCLLNGFAWKRVFIDNVGLIFQYLLIISSQPMVCGLEKTRSSFTIIRRLLDDYLSFWTRVLVITEKGLFQTIGILFGTVGKNGCYFFMDQNLFLCCLLYMCLPFVSLLKQRSYTPAIYLKT